MVGAETAVNRVDEGRPKIVVNADGPRDAGHRSLTQPFLQQSTVAGTDSKLQRLSDRRLRPLQER